MTEETSWTVPLLVLNLGVSVIVALVAWLLLRREARRWDGVERRVQVLETTGKLLPTREDMHLLRVDMLDSRTALQEVVKTTAEIRGAQQLVQSQITATERLVERTERTAHMVVQHLLDERK